ncbi:MAG: hypothetical protein Kow0063_33630 [Anaerolineae bacterium]
MDALNAGITAAREGRYAQARALLREALQANPRSEQGWLWMSAVVETDDERRICLERVLTINPHNQTAKAGLEKLEAPGRSPASFERYMMPSPQPAQVRTQEPGRRATPEASTGQVTPPPSPHSMPTLGIDPVSPRPRRIERLEPHPPPLDGLTQLRAAQFQPPPEPDTSPSESDPFMALVLIGGLSITAIAGALMLGVLWLIGWPP